MTRILQKKVKLSVFNRRTNWAPFWAVLRKYGTGKRVHPSQITKQRRHWRKNRYGSSKLKIKPRRTTKKHLG
jgi:hypothetical protein